MSGHPCRIVAAVVWAMCMAPLGMAEEPSVSTERAAFPDAQLNDVFVLDPDLAWAVGDRGTILHSADGGRTWSPQEAPVDARLMSVWFVDARNGWTVGGATRPYTLASQGVVLATGDGGETWEPVTGHPLPALENVRFFSAEEGVVVGRASSMQASGVFATQDGGQTWRGVPGGRGWSWQTGDFADPFTGAVAGRGLWAGIDRRTLKTPPSEPPRIRAIRDLQLVPPVGGWAAGDGGLVLTTPDLGRTWFEPPGTLPDFATRHFDLAAVAVHGANVWAAGSPGSRVFHSPDAGRTWRSFPTGTTTPLTSLHFSDPAHGIAVGALGVILKTGDGGRTWQTVRQGARRTPLLAIAARADGMPAEVLAQASAADGYLAALAVLFREPPDDVASTPAPQAVTTRGGDDIEGRLQEAVVTAGGTATHRAWRFPVRRDTQRTAEDLVSHLDRETDGRAMEQLESYLVRQIRTWRPDVIVVGGSATRVAAEDELTRELVLGSIDAAADPTRHIDLATDADLAAWQVKRAFVAAPEGANANVPIRTSSFVSHLGSTIADIAERTRGIMGMPSTVPDAASLQQVFPTDDAAVQLGSIFSGLALAPGSDGRRAAVPLSDEEVQQAARTAEKSRNVRAILTDQVGSPALASHLSAFTEGLDGASKARVLYVLAEGFRKEGRWRLAAETFQRLVREHPDDRLVDAALVWLVQYHAGSETQWSKGGDEGTGIRDLTGRVDGQEADATLAVEVGRLAAAVRPQLVLEPQVGVPLAAAYRRAGLTKEADRYMLLLRQRGAADAWQELAEAERWLANPTEQPPVLPIWTCHRTTQRPHLDGVLDEPFWQSARPARLARADRAAGREPLASLRLAYDGEFLYLGVRCDGVKEAEAIGPAEPQADTSAARPSGPRHRDEDLAGSAHVRLALDLDRDLTTFYELAADCRGRVREEGWRDSRWNPTWYVAHASDGQTWTIEAAIPLAELTDTPPEPRDVWCVGACHVSADGATTPWHGPAQPSATAASWGLLIFD